MTGVAAEAGRCPSQRKRRPWPGPYRAAKHPRECGAGTASSTFPIMAQALKASISMAAAPTHLSRCTRQAALPAAPSAASAGRACFFRGASLCAPAPRAARRQRQAACRAQACPIPHCNIACRALWSSDAAGKGAAAYAPVCCVQSTPLVGSEAPDFTAEAVFDQEFVTLSLSQYRVRALCALCWA